MCQSEIPAQINHQSVFFIPSSKTTIFNATKIEYKDINGKKLSINLSELISCNTNCIALNQNRLALYLCHNAYEAKEIARNNQNIKSFYAMDSAPNPSSVYYLQTAIEEPSIERFITLVDFTRYKSIMDFSTQSRFNDFKCFIPFGDFVSKNNAYTVNKDSESIEYLCYQLDDIRDKKIEVQYMNPAFSAKYYHETFDAIFKIKSYQNAGENEKLFCRDAFTLLKSLNSSIAGTSDDDKKLLDEIKKTSINVGYNNEKALIIKNLESFMTIREKDTTRFKKLAEIIKSEENNYDEYPGWGKRNVLVVVPWKKQIQQIFDYATTYYKNDFDRLSSKIHLTVTTPNGVMKRPRSNSTVKNCFGQYFDLIVTAGLFSDSVFPTFSINFAEKIVVLVSECKRRDFASLKRKNENDLELWLDKSSLDLKLPNTYQIANITENPANAPTSQIVAAISQATFDNYLKTENELFEITKTTDNKNTQQTVTSNTCTTVLSVIFDKGRGYFTKDHQILGKIKRDNRGKIIDITDRNANICSSNGSFESLCEDDFIIDKDDEVIIAQKNMFGSPLENAIFLTIDNMRKDGTLKKIKPEVEEAYKLSDNWREFLKECAQNNNLTQLANDIGVTLGTLQNWINDNHTTYRPDEKNLKKIGDYGLEVSNTIKSSYKVEVFRNNTDQCYDKLDQIQTYRNEIKNLLVDTAIKKLMSQAINQNDDVIKHILNHIDGILDIRTVFDMKIEQQVKDNNDCNRIVNC